MVIPMNSNTVLITGASRGIGKAIALRFGREGFRVALNCRSRADELAQVRAELEALHIPVFTSVGDVGDYIYAKELAAETKKALGSVDILINNAGISYVGLLSDMKPEEWDQIIRTNLTSVYNLSSLCIPDMVHRKSGKILNISSVWGTVGASCEVAYSASKGGVNTFTRALAKELAPSGVQVNAIACGAIDTEMNSFLSPDDRTALIEEIPAGRMGRTEEVAELAYSLCYKKDYLTGQIVTLDGGWI